MSSWAKATFYTCIYFSMPTIKRHGGRTQKNHHIQKNNPEEAANYVKAVDTLLKSFVSDIRGFNHYACQELSTHFIPASFQIRQRIFQQYGHRSCTGHNTRQGMCRLS